MTILVGTSARRHVGTSARRHVGTSARRHVGTSARRHGPQCAVGRRPPLGRARRRSAAPPTTARRLGGVVEDNVPTGGVGWAAGQAPRDADLDAPLRGLGIPEAVSAPRQARRGAGRHRAHPRGDRGTNRRRARGHGGCRRRGPEGERRMTDGEPKAFEAHWAPGPFEQGFRPDATPRRARGRALRPAHQVPQPPAAADAAHHRLRQGLRARRGRLLLGRRWQRLPRHARRVRRHGARPPPPRRPQGAARRPGRLARGPDPLRLPAAARPARREAARAQPAPGPGVLRQQRHRSRRDRSQIRPLRHRQSPGSCTARTPSTA